ncbi:helix-turn-helix domain-containing protein [Streptosporangium sp. CA-115845]|uniref:helix-turn-helix domain-containing protein n=1 Tax=Streptosporangium sp. CA-115845 TaxID=3240071 RepID=UPI003D9270AA
MSAPRELDPKAGRNAAFGVELRRLRLGAGLTQEELGNRIGYSTSQVGSVEVGKRAPTEPFIAGCETVFGPGLREVWADLSKHREWFRPWLKDDDTALWVAQLAAPQVQCSWGEDKTILLDVGTGSRADTTPDPAGGWTVHQHGPIKLWDEVEEAVLTWQGAGCPHQSGFGLTVAHDRQYVWLGDPDGPSWDLPA